MLPVPTARSEEERVGGNEQNDHEDCRDPGDRSQRGPRREITKYVTDDEYHAGYKKNP
jgi:hypothetical protein